MSRAWYCLVPDSDPVDFARAAAGAVLGLARATRPPGGMGDVPAEAHDVALALADAARHASQALHQAGCYVQAAHRDGRLQLHHDLGDDATQTSQDAMGCLFDAHRAALNLCAHLENAARYLALLSTGEPPEEEEEEEEEEDL